MQGWPSAGRRELLLPWGTCERNSGPEQRHLLGDQTGNVTDNGRWDGAGMSGDDTQRRDAAAGAGRAAGNTYRD